MILSITNKHDWDNFLNYFPDSDIYYTFEYCHSLQIHGDGKPMLIFYSNSDFKVCLSIMVNDISTSLLFPDLQENLFFDASTPYGYGGPLICGTYTQEMADLFYTELSEYLCDNNIVSLFIRFHPLLSNERFISPRASLIQPKNTVFIDTTSKESIYLNMSGKCRNMIRKAINNDVKIEYDFGENINIFKSIYTQAMLKHQASSYYYFNDDYFNYLKSNLKENFIVFYAYLDSTPISAAIFLYNKTNIHYHLSGTLSDFKNYAASNLIIASAAEWAYENNINKFHLGGGLEDEDSLFSFKKSFNKNGVIPYYIGKVASDEDKYNYLLQYRKKLDPSFDTKNSNMIQYRKES